MNYTYYRRYQPKKKRETFSSFFWFVIFLVISAIFLKSCFTSAVNSKNEKRDEAILSIDKGSAQITVWGDDTSSPAANSQIILEGDKIETAENTYATLSFYNGSKVTLDQKTTVVFSDVSTENTNDFLTLDLNNGRVFVNQIPNEEGQMTLNVKTDVMKIASVQTQYIASNIPDNEYVYVLNGEANPQLLDKDIVIENTLLKSGQKIAMPDSKQSALLARESVTLVESSNDDLLGDPFYTWTLVKAGVLQAVNTVSTGEISDEVIMNVETPVEVVEPAAASGAVLEGLVISVTSPISPATIEKDGIAIEGSILNGSAETVTVTWDGNNVPYTLKGFKSGGLSFRFVATSEYKNLKLGDNVYTVVAYDTAGKASNTVIVKVSAQFNTAVSVESL